MLAIDHTIMLMPHAVLMKNEDIIIRIARDSFISIGEIPVDIAGVSRVSLVRAAIARATGRLKN
jgi:hypothetical protein